MPPLWLETRRLGALFLHLILDPDAMQIALTFRGAPQSKSSTKRRRKKPKHAQKRRREKPRKRPKLTRSKNQGVDLHHPYQRRLTELPQAIFTRVSRRGRGEGCLSRARVGGGIAPRLCHFLHARRASKSQTARPPPKTAGNSIPVLTAFFWNVFSNVEIGTFRWCLGFAMAALLKPVSAVSKRPH